MILKFFTKKSASSYFYCIAAMFSVTILAASLIFLVNDYFNFKSTASYQIRAQNNNIRQKITDSLTHTKQMMSYVGKQISLHNPHDYKFINELLINYRSLQNNLLYWNIFAWVDDMNKVKVSSGIGIINEDIDLSDRDYLLPARETPETIHVGNPVIGKLSKMYLIPISYGIIDNHREYVGAVVAGLVIDNLTAQINNSVSDENVLFAIISGSGEVVTKSTKFDSGPNKTMLDKMVQNIKAYPGQELTSDFAYYQRLIECELECVNYGVITIYDNNAVAHYNMICLVIYLLVACFTISIAGFILFGFYEHIIYPIAILSETAQKICRNEPNRQMPKFEVRELSQLADSLAELDKVLWNKKHK